MSETNQFDNIEFRPEKDIGEIRRKQGYPKPRFQLKGGKLFQHPCAHLEFKHFAHCNQ